MQKSFKDVLEQLETTKQAKDFDTNEMSVPAWIEDLVKQYEKVKDIQKVKVSYCLHTVCLYNQNFVLCSRYKLFK